jgi:hypothetical protein
MTPAEIRLFAEAAAPALRDYVAEAVRPYIDKCEALERQLRHNGGCVESLSARYSERIANAEQELLRTAQQIGAAVASAGPTLYERITALEARTAGMIDNREDELAEMRAEIIALKELAPIKGEPGERGERGLDGAPGEAGEPGPVGEKGEPGSNGADGKDGRDGVDGKDAEPITPEQIREAVAEWLEANPPQPGEKGEAGPQGEPGLPGDRGERGDPGERGEKGMDGAPAPIVVGAIKDHMGELVLTLTDGTVLKTGIFDGRDGEAGKDGRDGADPDAVTLSWGEDGRTLTMKLMYGDTAIVSEAEGGPGPFLIDRGVFREGQDYQKGDAVTWGGSVWFAQEPTTEKPGEGSKAWRLAVKRGRDGKDGVNGEKGVEGKQGPPGRDGKGW